MLIQSHDRFEDVAAFDPNTGRLTQFTRSAPGRQRHLLAEPVRGHFAQLGDVVTVLYRHDDALWLRMGPRAANLDSITTKVRRVHVGAEARLELVEGATKTAVAEYVPGPKTGPPLADDPTAFVESEDWDFGLFVCNVLGDSGRRRRIYSPGSPA
jgi:hypothetical protein